MSLPTAPVTATPDTSALASRIRDAEVDLDEEEADSLREAVSEALRRRRFEPVVKHPNSTMRTKGRRKGEKVQVHELDNVLLRSHPEGRFTALEIMCLQTEGQLPPHLFRQPTFRLGVHRR